MRHPNPRALLLVASLLVAALLSGCAVTRVLDEPWLEIQSEHFVITTDMDRKKAEELAVNLELFRAAVLRLTGSSDRSAKIPTRVFFFRETSSFRPFRVRRGYLGYFNPRLRENFVAIVDDRRYGTTEILRHEYVHFLMSNGSRRVYPKWYREGFAELLSTTQRTGAHITVGMIPEASVKDLARFVRRRGWVPIRYVLECDGWKKGCPPTFYSQSWALLHYLTRTVEHAGRLGRSVQTYLDELESGATVDEACQAGFGMSPDALDDAVREHLASGSYTPFGVRADRLAWSDYTESRAIGRGELAVRLGELAASIGKTETAAEFFRAALVAEPQLAAAHARLGDLLVSTGRPDEARAHLDQALALDPDDPLNHLDWARYHTSLAANAESAEEREALLTEARSHIQHAIELDEWKPEPWTLYGETFLVEGQDPSRGVEPLEKAHRMLPASQGVQLTLAEVYVAADRPKEAEQILRRLAALGHNSQIVQEARRLLEASALEAAAP